MAKQRYINTKFWDDSYIRKLNTNEKLLFLYLLTNSLTNISGIYEIDFERICFDTGIKRKTIDEILKKFQRNDKIYNFNEWICIKNFLKHQNIKSPKVKKGVEMEILHIPDDIMKKIYGIDTLSNLVKYCTDTISHSNSNLTKLNSNSNSIPSPPSKKGEDENAIK